MNDDITFGTWLKRRRQVLRLTQQDLAQRIGCSAITIRKIEADERRPSAQIAELLAARLEIAPAERPAFIRFARALSGAAEVKPPQSRETAPWHAARAPATNLPSPLTPLVGREHELSLLQQFLLQPDVRLLTVLGPPGVGKTRLSLALAQSALEHFADGVYFVSLASVNEPELVVAAIARTLRARQVSQFAEPTLDLLKQWLHDQQMLLVLDNFEQVVRAAPLVADLLQASPSLKVLATSREALHLRGEKQFPLSPLTFPAPLDAGTELESLPERYPAVKLFVERAQTLRPEFRLTHENASALAEICARLDGLPLAIELVAARVRSLSPEQLLMRLLNAQGRFQLRMVADGLSDLPVRQQTLHNAIDWSYNLLSAAERVVFRRLSVFVGGCTLEAAEKVTSDSDNSVLDAMTSLLDKSLLQQYEQDGEQRFSMLETIREFALEKFSLNAGEADAVRRRHAEYFLALAEQARPQLTGAEQRRWLDRLEREHDNLRAALHWSLETGNAELAAQMQAFMWRFWWLRGHLTEGRRWMAQTLAHDDLTAQTRTRLLMVAGSAAWSQSDFEQAERLLNEALSISQLANYQDEVAGIHHVLGNVWLARGDLEQAASHYQQAMALFREQGNIYSLMTVLNNLGIVRQAQRNSAEARKFHEESLALARQYPDKQSLAYTLIGLSDALITLHDYDKAAICLDESLRLARELSSPIVEAHTLRSLGRIAQHTGQFRQSQSYFAQDIALLKQIGAKREIADVLDHFAELNVALNQPYQALVLLAASSAVREAIHVPRSAGDEAELEPARSAVRAQLGELEVAEAWASGQGMTLDQAIDFALKDH